MSFIVVYGTPPESSQEILEKLMEAMVETTREASDLEHDWTEIKVWFPEDRMAKGLGHEFTVDVARLPAKGKDRTLLDSCKIAARYCDVVASFFPDYWHIDCEVRPFREHKGGDAARKGVRPPKED